MNLPGRVNTAILGEVLGALHRARATGALELLEWTGSMSGRVHRVHWIGGLVSQVETGLAVSKLGELLRREGFLTPEGSRRLAQRLIELPGRRAGEILVAEGLVTSDVVTAALRFQLRNKLDALSRLGEVRVRFHVALAGDHRERLSVPLSPQEFLQERAGNREPSGAGPRTGRTPSSGGRDLAGAGGERYRALRTLGLGAPSDRAAVQRAFRRLAAQVHPDRFPCASPAERTRLLERFSELSAAYHLLVA